MELQPLKSELSMSKVYIIKKAEVANQIGANSCLKSCSICIGIISGADAATGIIFGGSGQGKLHAACSALHFEPVDDVEWRMEFHEKRREDVTVELM